MPASWFRMEVKISYRGVGRYLKLGGKAVIWGAQSVLYIEIGLTDLPKPGWAIAHSAQPSPTPLSLFFG